MIEYTLKELESRTINSLIDSNERFCITVGEEDPEEEEKTRDVINKIAILRARRNSRDTSDS